MKKPEKKDIWEEGIEGIRKIKNYNEGLTDMEAYYKQNIKENYIRKPSVEEMSYV